MNLHRNVLATLLVAASLASVGGRSYAGPLSASISLRDAIPQTVETVQWRGGGWRGGWGGGWRGGWRGGWGGGWRGVGLGLAAGAIIGGGLAAPYYGGYGYYSSPYYGDGYDYGYYSPAYYRDYYAPNYYGGGYARSIYGGYWPGYRPRVYIAHRPYWGSW
jgi:hypothetical protein